MKQSDIEKLSAHLSEASKAAIEAANAMSLVAGELRVMNDMMRRMMLKGKGKA